MENYPRTILELEKRFASEQACRDYLFTLRWPEGFVCPRCAGDKAWAWLHKLRRAMVRPGRDRLSGRIEVDEAFLGAPEKGVVGRETRSIESF